MSKQYENGRWVAVQTTTGGTATNASTGSALPQRDTPTQINSTSSGSGDSSSGSATEEYDEESYDIVEGTINIKKADMGLKCRGSVALKGLGKVFSSTYYVTGVKITLNATTMKQTLTVHKDSLGAKKKVTTVAAANTKATPVETKKATKTYTVKRGDSLSKIAKNELGKASRWNEIYQLNKSVIGSNPNLIYPGQVYTLPT